METKKERFTVCVEEIDKGGWVIDGYPTTENSFEDAGEAETEFLTVAAYLDSNERAVLEREILDEAGEWDYCETLMSWGLSSRVADISVCSDSDQRLKHLSSYFFELERDPHGLIDDFDWKAGIKSVSERDMLFDAYFHVENRLKKEIGQALLLDIFDNGLENFSELKKALDQFECDVIFQADGVEFWDVKKEITFEDLLQNLTVFELLF